MIQQYHYTDILLTVMTFQTKLQIYPTRFKHPSLDVSIHSLYDLENLPINEKTFAISYSVTDSKENYDIT